MSRASSPENDFVDVESTDRPQSAASGTSQRPTTSSGMPVTPEAKRNRGRPRKQKDTPDDRMLTVHFFMQQFQCIGQNLNDFFFVCSKIVEETWPRKTA